MGTRERGKEVREQVEEEEEKKEGRRRRGKKVKGKEK